MVNWSMLCDAQAGAGITSFLKRLVMPCSDCMKFHVHQGLMEEILHQPVCTNLVKNGIVTFTISTGAWVFPPTLSTQVKWPLCQGDCDVPFQLRKAHWCSLKPAGKYRCVWPYNIAHGGLLYWPGIFTSTFEFGGFLHTWIVSETKIEVYKLERRIICETKDRDLSPTQSGRLGEG